MSLASVFKKSFFILTNEYYIVLKLPQKFVLSESGNLARKAFNKNIFAVAILMNVFILAAKVIDTLPHFCRSQHNLRDQD